MICYCWEIKKSHSRFTGIFQIYCTFHFFSAELPVEFFKYLTLKFWERNSLSAECYLQPYCSLKQGGKCAFFFWAPVRKLEIIPLKLSSLQFARLTAKFCWELKRKCFNRKKYAGLLEAVMSKLFFVHVLRFYSLSAFFLLHQDDIKWQFKPITCLHDNTMVCFQSFHLFWPGKKLE